MPPSYDPPVDDIAQVPTAPGRARLQRLPPQSFFLVSAVFHYLGPAFAVLLFAHLDVLGVAWLRIAGAAALFAVWRRPGGCSPARTGVGACCSASSGPCWPR
jgi:inner membrane transporter RhtA